MDRLTRIAALAAALAALLAVVAQVMPYVPDHPWLEALYAAIDLGYLFALAGLIAAAAPRIAAPGLALLLVALGAVASIVGPDRTVFGIDFYLAGSVLFALSLGLAAPWLARLPGLKPPALAWAAAALTTLIAGATASPLAARGAGVILAAGFALLAVPLWRGAVRG